MDHETKLWGIGRHVLLSLGDIKSDFELKGHIVNVSEMQMISANTEILFRPDGMMRSVRR